MNHPRRLRALRRSMTQQQVEAVLVTHLPDVRYLCGFTGSNAALAITATRATLFTDGRYTSQAREESQGLRVKIAAESALREACAYLASTGASQVHFDPEYTIVATLAAMKETLATKRGNFFRPLKSPLVSTLRLTKDADELTLLRKAAQLGCHLFEALLPQVEPGIPETSIAAQLEFAARIHGAEAMSFETIVATGPRSALPHGRATAARLPRNGFVTLDFGVILKGYCSDMTRTVHLGKTSRRERSAYEAVLDAQQAAVAVVRPGVTCSDIDEAARSVLREASLADYFTHSTGHGVGIEIHEQPRIAAGQETKLTPGMVITIEPGIYIPGQFGIRIEDMVAVTGNGNQILTPVAKALIEL